MVPPSNTLKLRTGKSTQTGLLPQKCPTSVATASVQVELFPSLRINGDDFTAPPSDQEDPVQTLHEDFEELHVCRYRQGEEHGNLPETASTHSIGSRAGPGLRIQFSSPPLFFGGPGMLSRTSWAPWDLLTTTSFNFTAVCIRRTFDWFLVQRNEVEQRLGVRFPINKDPTQHSAVLTDQTSTTAVIIGNYYSGK